MERELRALVDERDKLTKQVQQLGENLRNEQKEKEKIAQMKGDEERQHNVRSVELK